MKKLFGLALIAGALTFAGNIYAADSSTAPVASDEDYSKWEVAQYVTLAVPIEGTNGVFLKAWLGVGRVLVENSENEESRYLTEYEIFGTVVLRTHPDDPKTFQMLVAGKWVTGKQGNAPKAYLAMKNHFLGTSEIVGVRLVLDAADGRKPLEVVMKPRPAAGSMGPNSLDRG